MKREPKRLVSGTTLTTSTTTLYTTPAGTWTTIAAMTVTNVTTAVAKLTVYLVPDSGSASTDNVVLFERSLAPGESRIVGEAVGQTLNPGATIQAKADTASALNMVASGYETVT